MVFSSLIFLFVFLPVSIVVYYLAPKKLRNLVLFAVSLLFYAWGEPAFVFVMLFSVVINYTAGRLLAHFREAKKLSSVLFISAVVLNLGLLCWFKYSPLFVKTVDSLSLLKIPVPEVTLPIGISFYTFEALSYLIDIRNQEACPQTSLLDFGTYLSFYPHLVAGPIIRYRDFAPQLTDRRETLQEISEGAVRFLTGLFKKVLLANNLAQIADRIQYYGHPSMLGGWICAFALTFQIYFDFSGYSDMAIGLGRMFGFRLPENFNYPYLSRSAADFWRRWHITLGSWFREYLYIPLGGNRCSKLKNIRNLAIVWVLTGFWHGASWNFAIWGAYWGILIITEKYVIKGYDKAPAWLQWICSFLTAAVGWVLFFNTDFSKAGVMLAAMFGFASKIDSVGLYGLTTGWLLLLLAACFSTPVPARLVDRLRNSGAPGKIIWCAGYTFLFVVSLSFLVENSYNPFLYFRF
jgi:alginate O-acetyltransferase complex protein AlgI